MNFFSIGFVLCALNFNMGWELNYILRVVGTLFMLSGIKEADSVSDGFSQFRGVTLVVGAASAAGLAAMLGLRFGIIPHNLENPLSIVFGLAAAVTVLVSQRQILAHMLVRHELVNDPSLLHALDGKWKRCAFFAALSVAADVLYRVLPESGPQAGIGAVEVFSRIIMYIYVVLLATAFARVRHDFNIMHPV